jgi:hypothetical protein
MGIGNFFESCRFPNFTGLCRGSGEGKAGEFRAESHCLAAKDSGIERFDALFFRGRKSVVNEVCG